MAASSQDEAASALQARVLLELAQRLAAGDRPLPTDVFGQLVEELETRADAEAVEEAWAIQGEEEATPWAIVRARALG